MAALQTRLTCDNRPLIAGQAGLVHVCNPTAHPKPTHLSGYFAYRSRSRFDYRAHSSPRRSRSASRARKQVDPRNHDAR